MFSASNHKTQTSRSLAQELDGIETPGLIDHGYASGRRIEFLTLPLIAEGGEGWVLDAESLRCGEVLKLFKPPAMVQFKGSAIEKWDEYPKKLQELALLELPSYAVKPTGLVSESRKTGSRVLGYFMPRVNGIELTNLTTLDSRKAAGYDKNGVMQIFSRIYELDHQLHSAGIIIGDNKPQNILIKAGRPYRIDLESAGFGKFECRGVSEPYLDPLLCDPNLQYPEKIYPYSEQSDLYANEVMLFEGLLGFGPFGGVYVPPRGEARITDQMRPLKGVSVFNRFVGLPNFVEGLAVLSDAMRVRFVATFEHSNRDKFPDDLLKTTWTVCSPCKIEHAHIQCPKCLPNAGKVEFKRAGEQKKTVLVETVRGIGAAAFLGTALDSHPIVVEVKRSNDRLELYVNNEKIISDLDPALSLTCMPLPDLVFLNAGNGKVLFHSKSAKRNSTIVNVKQGPDGPLDATCDTYYGYLDATNTLNLIAEKYPRNGLRFTPRVSGISNLTLGRRVIALGSTSHIELLDVNKSSGTLNSSRFPVSSDHQLLTLQAHRTVSQVLAVFKSRSVNRYTCQVISADGRVELEVSSNKETLWWFGDQIVDGKPTLLYWQGDKICLSSIIQSIIH